MSSIFKDILINVAIVFVTFATYYFFGRPGVAFIVGMAIGCWVMALHILYVFKKRTGNDFPSQNKKDNK